MSISYRVCTSNEDYDAIHDLELIIWNMPSPAEAVASHMMHIVAHTGGMVMGAFDGERIVGLAVALATKYPGRLWSHMAGVHPDYQGQGIGYQIKQFQRTWAIEQGYTEMRWTFDPALRRNAHFNFHLLDATTHIYRPNFYGMMTDGLNAGVSSDRFELVWQLKNKEKIAHDLPDNLSFLLDIDNGKPVIKRKATERYHAVQCPYDFSTVKVDNLDLAIQWRQTMSEVLQSAFQDGYQIVDFVTERDRQQCWYVLHHQG